MPLSPRQSIGRRHVNGSLTVTGLPGFIRAGVSTERSRKSDKLLLEYMGGCEGIWALREVSAATFERRGGSGGAGSGAVEEVLGEGVCCS